MDMSAENAVREAGAPGDAPLAGRTFVVTGAGRDLGVAFAMVFADAGADLLLTGRDLGHLEAVRDTVVWRSGRTATITALDLADPLNAAETMRSLAQTSLGIDGLINNGAAWQSGTLLDHDDAEIARVIASHITGTLLGPNHSRRHFSPLPAGICSTSSRPRDYPTPHSQTPHRPSMPASTDRPG